VSNDEVKFTDDFTPIQEELVQKYNMSVALVFGKIWRYSQSEGYCWASKTTIAYELGISRTTVENAIRKLEGKNLNNEFDESMPKLIVDVTPDNYLSKMQVRWYAPLMENFYNFIDEWKRTYKKRKKRFDREEYREYIDKKISDSIAQAKNKQK
jgi:hypothetical protein